MSRVTKTLRNIGWYPKRSPAEKFLKHFGNKVMPDLEKFLDEHKDELLAVLKKFIQELLEGKLDGMSTESKVKDLYERIKNKIREIVRAG